VSDYRDFRVEIAWNAGVPHVGQVSAEYGTPSERPRAPHTATLIASRRCPMSRGPSMPAEPAGVLGGVLGGVFGRCRTHTILHGGGADER
jgi:hypothetical protein